MKIEFEGKTIEKVIAQMIGMLAQFRGIEFKGKDESNGPDQTAGNRDTSVQD